MVVPGGTARMFSAADITGVPSFAARVTAVLETMGPPRILIGLSLCVNQFRLCQ